MLDMHTTNQLMAFHVGATLTLIFQYGLKDFVEYRLPTPTGGMTS